MQPARLSLDWRYWRAKRDQHFRKRARALSTMLYADGSTADMARWIRSGLKGTTAELKSRGIL